MSRPGQATPGAPELGAALSLYRNVLIGIGLISGMINVLYLTGSLFMLEVYDRVIPSRSIPTLVGLALITAGLFTFQGVLDMIRARIFVRLGSALDEALAPRAYDAVLHLRLRARGGRDGLQPLRDLEQVRAFLVQQRPGRAVRPALDAGLSGDLLRLPFPDRRRRPDAAPSSWSRSPSRPRC